MDKSLLKKILPILLFTGMIGNLNAQTFTDVTIAAGITNPNGITRLVHDGAGATDVMGVGSGAAWLDYDTDGDLDLYLTMRTGANKLYRNNGGIGTFTEVAAAAGVQDVSGEGAGVVVGDINNDGLPDLFLNNCHNDKMFVNDGDGTFTDITVSSGLEAILGDRRGTSATFGDYNGDGFLDLYVSHHFMTNGTQAEANRKDFLIYNNGDNTFTDVSSLLPYNDIIGFGFIGGWVDYDQDGDQDIIVVNDCESLSPQYDFPTRIFRNDGGTDPITAWTFTEVSETIGMDDCRNGMGIAIGDYDRDGWQDVFYTNIGPVVLFDNDNGVFSDVTSGSGLDIQATLDYSWGCTFVDYDLDGWQDIFVALGELNHSDADDRPNQMFKNNGDGTFTEVANSLGIDSPMKSRNGIFGDYDNDGDLDLFTVNYSGDFILFRNDVPPASHHYLKVYVSGTESSADALGSEVTVVHGGATIRQTFMVRSGSNLGGGEEIGAFFGLGTDMIVDSLIVLFPNGETDIQTNIAVDQSISVTEPTAPLPVDLSYFEARKNKEEVELEWTTASETENKYFEIERSPEGRDFEVIGRVNGNGTTSSFSDYSFIDETPLRGNNYYRLRQLDFDGSASLSEVKIVNFESNITEVKVIPNPVKQNEFTLSYAGEEAEVNFGIYDIFGKQIQLGIVQNNELQEVEVGDLPNGIYILKLSGESIHHTEKIIISK